MCHPNASRMHHIRQVTDCACAALEPYPRLMGPSTRRPPSLQWKGWLCLGIVGVGFVCMLLEVTEPALGLPLVRVGQMASVLANPGSR